MRYHSSVEWTNAKKFFIDDSKNKKVYCVSKSFPIKVSVVLVIGTSIQCEGHTTHSFCLLQNTLVKKEMDFYAS